jgi:hypothetical protein
MFLDLRRDCRELVVVPALGLTVNSTAAGAGAANRPSDA